MALPHELSTTPVRRMILTVVSWSVGIAFALPLLWMLSGSLRSSSEIFTNLYPLRWEMFVPERLTLDNYARLITGEFGLAVLNSILVTVVTIILGLLLSSLAAFALSAIPFSASKGLFAVVVFSFLIPFEAIAIPLATSMRDVGLANSYTALILPGLANGLAIFMLRQFFLAIPTELAEAARLDGLGWWDVYWRVYLPLSKPALIGAGFTLFLFQWGAYLWPLLIATDPSKVMGPIALANLNGQFEVDFGAIFAGSVILTLVPMLLLFGFQRFFTASLATSGSKG